ncbi:MAG: pyridoxamine 5'-phosphate oxidase family protein [Odoribacteraceae bacterium]|jgi:nitroimidazol reductase NimA-like FMN-containing flavoprotein (pyridoxamine 5'-phosphate oxidase superfamily)|nr:pyridoxamine 5'-phosphate oxidase family protein [Odoribacteraceae bacterium]
MKHLTEKQAECLKVMENASIVYLTNIDKEGCPSTRAMLNLKNPGAYPGLAALHEAEENPLAVFLTTNTSSRKFAEIQQNGKACLYYHEPGAFQGVLLQGTVEIVTDDATRQKAWQKGWEMYYPAGDSDYTLLRFVPTRLKTYASFTVATEIFKPGQNTRQFHAMRRKDKEIADVNEKLKIIAQGKVCRLALSDDDQPYIVPLNYGYSFENDGLILYFHSAREGKKLEIIKKNNRACFEIDRDGVLVEGEKPCDHGYAFESIVGTGKIILLDAAAEKEDGLNRLVQHQSGKNETCHFDEKMMGRVVVYKMIVEEFTGKRGKNKRE